MPELKIRWTTGFAQRLEYFVRHSGWQMGMVTPKPQKTIFTPAFEHVAVIPVRCAKDILVVPGVALSNQGDSGCTGQLLLEESQS